MRVAREPTSRIVRLASRLWREHTSPARLGLAVAVGIIVGCSPFFGLHLWIGLGLAVLLRLNKVAVFLGSQISIPPLAPLLGFSSVQVGALVLTGETVRLEVDAFRLSQLYSLLRQFLLDWVVGGLLVGLALALPAFLITFVLVRARRNGDRSGSELDHQWRRDLRAAAERYREAPPGHRHYARIKYRMDPLYRQVCELLGQRGRIVDLGTGLGMLPLLLALRGQGERIVGVDWDEAKVRSGQRAASGLEAVLELRHQDIREHELDADGVDAVVLADVLHYWPEEEQQAMLRRAAAALRPGGRLVIRETDREARSLVTRALEAVAVRLGWNRGPGLTYRTAEELREALRALGLRCGADEASSSAVHRGNVLIWADRP